MLMMTFHFRLKRISKPGHRRLKFVLEKLKCPDVLGTIQAMIDDELSHLDKKKFRSTATTTTKPAVYAYLHLSIHAFIYT